MTILAQNTSKLNLYQKLLTALNAVGYTIIQSELKGRTVQLIVAVNRPACSPNVMTTGYTSPHGRTSN